MAGRLPFPDMASAGLRGGKPRREENSHDPPRASRHSPPGLRRYPEEDLRDLIDAVRGLIAAARSLGLSVESYLTVLAKKSDDQILAGIAKLSKWSGKIDAEEAVGLLYSLTDVQLIELEWAGKVADGGD